MSLFDSIYEGATGALNFIGQAAEAPYRMWQQKQTWNREDTAVQRRVADLKAAGLSPTLAAGSAATTSSPISVNAPEYNPMLIQDLVKQKADISRTRSEEAALLARHATDFQMKNVIDRMFGLMTEGDVPFRDKLMFKMAEGMLAEQDAKIAQAKQAQVDAASKSRLLDFDVSNNLYGKAGRDVTELLRIMQNGDAGQKIGVILQLLGNVIK